MTENEPERVEEADHGPFEDLGKHDSTPSVPPEKWERIRFSRVAGELDNARLQAFIEANLGIEALRTVQKIVPLLAGLI